MKSNILVCPECKRYSMADTCPECDARTNTPHPSRFSPEDRYGKYRRELKALAEEEEG